MFLLDAKVWQLVENEEQNRRLAALHERVRSGGNEADGPVRELLARIGDRWSPLIMLILQTGMLRSGQLRKAINAMADVKISQRILTLKLRGLERDGMVARHVVPTVPPQVEYELTELGVGLAQRLDELLSWLEMQAESIEAARRSYDADP